MMTGSELPSTADRPESGQDGDPCERETRQQPNSLLVSLLGQGLVGEDAGPAVVGGLAPPELAAARAGGFAGAQWTGMV